jgi:hypothetical protein
MLSQKRKRIFFTTFYVAIYTGTMAQPAYRGGIGRGDQFVATGLLVITGSAAPQVYTGGSGRGDNGLMQGLVVVDGSTAPTLYAGGTGRGDNNSFQPLIVISGAVAPNLYAGGSGRGDFGTDLPLTVITGAAAPDIYRGGLGRGDFASDNTSLVDCNAFIVWTGAVNNNWSNAANWSCGVVPGPQHRVYILEGRPRYPVINGTVNILRLEVQPKAAVGLLQNAQLIITGTEK